MSLVDLDELFNYFCTLIIHESYVLVDFSRYLFILHSLFQIKGQRFKSHDLNTTQRMPQPPSSLTDDPV